MKIELSPSMLSSDLSNIKYELERLKNNNIKYIHLDIMDGIFVPNITFGFPVIESMCKYKEDGNFIFDTHLMITSPEKYIERFCKIGCDYITFHIEATKNINQCIELVKSNNKKVGISINPDTDVSSLFPYLERIDLALIMGVFPGFSGQKYIENTENKIKILNDEIKKRKLENNVIIEVDGGIDNTNIKKVVEAGANLIVSGSYIFKGDIKERIDSLLHYI